MKLKNFPIMGSSTFRKYFVSIFLSMFLVLTVLGLSLLVFITGYWRETNVSVLKENVKTLSESSSRYYDMEEDGQYINSAKVVLAYSLSLVSSSINSDIYVCDFDGNIQWCKDTLSTIKKNQLESIDESNHYCKEHASIKIPQNVIDNAKKGDFEFSGKLDDLYGDEFVLLVGEPIKNTQGDVVAVIIGAQQGIDNMSKFVTSILDMFLISSLLAFVVAFVSIYIVTYSITKPLRKMSKITKEYAIGKFNKRIEIKGNNEIAELGRGLNAMAQSLSDLEYSRRSFVANVSHELKTPMTTIGGFIDGILDGTIPPEKEEHYLKIVSNEVKRLARLVTSMLNLSKIEAGEMSLNLKQIDISALIFNTMLSFEQLINKKSIDIRGLDTIESLTVNVDKGLITQVIYNLVDNAVKFTEEGGYIDVRATQNDETTTIILRNSGAGVPTKEIERIFERFYKIDKSRGLDSKSTGLGLYIVKSIVEMHGGIISADSKVGKYTEFTITLPNV